MKMEMMKIYSLILIAAMGMGIMGMGDNSPNRSASLHSLSGIKNIQKRSRLLIQVTDDQGVMNDENDSTYNYSESKAVLRTSLQNRFRDNLSNDNRHSILIDNNGKISLVMAIGFISIHGCLMAVSILTLIILSIILFIERKERNFFMRYFMLNCDKYIGMYDI